MTPKPRPRVLPSPPERVALAVTAVAALAAWVFLEASGDGNLGVLLFFAVFAVHSLAAPAVRLRAGASAVDDPTVADSFGERVLALAAPRKITWWLPVALLPIMLVTMPIAYHHSPGNNSIVGLAFATALFAGTIGTVIGSGIWTLVVGPILLATRTHSAPAAA